MTKSVFVTFTTPRLVARKLPRSASLSTRSLAPQRLPSWSSLLAGTPALPPLPQVEKGLALKLNQRLALKPNLKHQVTALNTPVLKGARTKTANLCTSLRIWSRNIKGHREYCGNFMRKSRDTPVMRGYFLTPNLQIAVTTTTQSKNVVTMITTSLTSVLLRQVH